MTTASPVSVRRPISTAVTELYERNRILCSVAVAHLALAVLFTGLMYVDGRTLLGRNVWTKPWKFATSIAIFTATIGWVLPSLALTDRVERIATYTIGTAMTIEIVLISVQAARGVASHFNMSTPLNSIIFTVMGVTITISSLVVGYVLWRSIRNPPALAPPYRWGLWIGMLVFLVASFEGWLMVAHDAHAVGVPNDSPGLTLLNWSVTGGDLRIAHFIGLHALQVLPLTGYVVSRWNGLSARGALVGVGVVGALYSGVTMATFIVAIRGHPLVSSLVIPSVPSSVVASGLLLASLGGLVALAWVWRHDGLARSASEAS